MESKKSGMTLFDFGFKTSMQQAESTLRDEDDVFQEVVAGEGKSEGLPKDGQSGDTGTKNCRQRVLDGHMISKVRLLLRSNQMQSQTLRQVMWK